MPRISSLTLNNVKNQLYGRAEGGVASSIESSQMNFKRMCTNHQHGHVPNSVQLSMKGIDMNTMEQGPAFSIFLLLLPL
jgi:hypothetical protein